MGPRFTETVSWETSPILTHGGTAVFPLPTLPLKNSNAPTKEDEIVTKWFLLG